MRIKEKHPTVTIIIREPQSNKKVSSKSISVYDTTIDEMFKAITKMINNHESN